MWSIDNHYTIFKNNQAVQEHVVISKKEKYCVITEVIEEDFTQATDEAIIKEVLDAFYKKVYLDRAENEQFAQLREINKRQEEQLKKSTDLLTKTNLAMFEMTDKVLSNEDKVNFLFKHLQIEFNEEDGEEDV